jgi:hypothetical protein
VEDLPNLAKKYHYEARLVEFAAIDLNWGEFYRRNLYTRHIVIVSVAKVSVVYGSFKRIGNFCSLLYMMMFFVSIWFTIDGTMIYVKT